MKGINELLRRQHIEKEFGLFWCTKTQIVSVAHVASLLPDNLFWFEAYTKRNSNNMIPSLTRAKVVVVVVLIVCSDLASISSELELKSILICLLKLDS